MTNCSICSSPLVNHPRGRRRVTCSRKCRSALGYQNKLAKAPVIYRLCKFCGKQFQVSNETRVFCSKGCSYKHTKKTISDSWHDSKKHRPHFKEIECSYCSRPVTVPSSFTQKIVSHPECKVERKKARNRIKQTRRRGYRATLRNLSVENMGDRDNWTCHICREPVNPLLPSNHREGASVDHVIPLSRGGSDEPENLKLSHWICNVRKSNKVNYAQSR